MRLGAGREYNAPETLIADLRDAPPGSHSTIQFYRLVTGNVPGSHQCTGPTSTHMTYTAELYCYEDLQRVIALLPTDYVATDALTVAQPWGVPGA